MKSGIYCIRHIQSGRVYIGSAVYIANRWASHRCQLRAGKHRNTKLQRAWDKYGEDAFVFEVVERCRPEELVGKEQGYIDSLNSVDAGFNVLRVAGSALGFKHSPEHIERLKGNQHRKGIPHDAETRARISESLRGNQYSLGFKHPPEFGANISAKLKGIKRSPETRAAMSAALRKRWSAKRAGLQGA